MLVLNKLKVWLCLILGAHSTHSDSISIFGEYTTSGLYRQRRQTNCDGSDQFTCESGQCISDFHMCDGTPHCIDKSDETSAVCSKISCTGITFQCAYGACIRLRGLCNGITDCIDNSDENIEMCGYTSQLTPLQVTTPISAAPTIEKSSSPVIAEGSCVLPTHIQNGQWKIWGNPTIDYHPGDRVQLGQILEIKCKKGYKLDYPTNFSVCYAGSWTPNVPGCIQTCPSLESTPSTRVTCTNKGREINCSKAVSHTTARYSCAPFHELLRRNSILYCLDGSWGSTRPICEPICGQEIAAPKDLILGREHLKQGSAPWSIGIYRTDKVSFTHICGGSLISSRLIVTAAHCVSGTDGKMKSEDMYRVAAGKYYRNYNDFRETNAEFSQIEKIFVNDRYKGSTSNYESDIAVLVTKEAFNTTKFIQRVCIDWHADSFNTNRLLGMKGTITGWGYTASINELSPALKEVSVPYVDFSQCYNILPDLFKRYLTVDKMCAGRDEQGTGICKGDSGGGLTFMNHNDNNRHYLIGVLSISAGVSDECDAKSYTLYTKVSSYLDFIASIYRSYLS